MVKRSVRCGGCDRTIGHVEKSGKSAAQVEAAVRALQNKHDKEAHFSIWRMNNF